MWIITYRNIFYGISGLLIAGSLAAIALFGMRLGIEFTGGTLIDASYQSRPDKGAIEEALNTLGLGTYSLRPAGENRYLLRTRDLPEGDKTKVLTAMSLSGSAPTADVKATTIGPVIGDELSTKAAIAIALVILMVVIYVAFVFRKVSKPVSSLWYGLITIAALAHDVIIPLGTFAVLAHLLGYEVDILFVTAMLTILGYSVSDTVVVFDRVRENLKRNTDQRVKEPFEEVVGRSLSQTFTRSINSSVTTFLAVTALYFLGAESTRQFALALLIGIGVGAYSSLFIASPLLVTVQKWRPQVEEEDTPRKKK